MCHTFESGERLVLYTDGVTDAHDIAQERFGQQRLEQLIRRHSAGPDVLADQVMSGVDRFRRKAPQTDDETIVVLDRI
jgi:sigma-B regulation protein RsbU (phosphoserine phosphatase)